MLTRVQVTGICALLACCALWPQSQQVCFARTRGKSVTISQAGRLQDVGGRGKLSAPRSLSYGLGGLQKPGAPTGPLQRSLAVGSSFALRSSIGGRGSPGTALRSNILRPSGPGRPRSDGKAGASPPIVPVPAPGTGAGGKRIQPFSLSPQGGKGISAALLASKTDLAAARAFIQSVGKAGGALDKSDQPITSLVPDQGGRYRNYMARGEEHFRSGDFAFAFTQFRLANDIIGRSPETLLSMAHAKFATARLSYASAAFYLRKALKYLPELPLAPLRPKAFYNNPATFGEHIFHLEDHLEKSPYDGEALLLLAYFRWFTDEPDVKTARSALSKALAVSHTDETTEAIETFWDGMVASGKVSGKLLPTTRPAKKVDSPAGRSS